MKGLYEWWHYVRREYGAEWQVFMSRVRAARGEARQVTEPAAEHSHHWLYTVDEEVLCSDCGARPDAHFWEAIKYSFARTWDPPRGMATSEGRKRRVFEMGETHP